MLRWQGAQMKAKWLLTSLLAAALLPRFVPAQVAGRGAEPAQPQASAKSLPEKSFLGKDAAMKAHRDALDVFNVAKLEDDLKDAKSGESFRGEKFGLEENTLLTKDEVLLILAERNRKKIEAFKASLPMDGAYYVVEGDLLLTDDEIAGYLSLTSRLKEFGFLQEGGLMVNINDGEDDYYKTPESRRLTYSVDRQSFGAQQYEQVTADLAQAAKEWQESCPGCGVTFTQTEARDARPSHEGANFVVRAHDAKGVYLVSAFFPHEPPERRYLNIDPRYFNLASKAERVAVLRHQLGHILGYRHVQPRDIAGCYYKGGTFLSLSKYTGNSVMGYFCSGDTALAQKLTDADVAFHRRTYESLKINTHDGRPIGAAVTLVTKYEGGDVAGNVAAIFRELVRLNLVHVASYNVAGGGETVKSIYQRLLRLPVDSQTLVEFATEFAKELNKGRLKDGPLAAGTEVFYPEVQFNQYEQVLKLDSDSKEDKDFEKELQDRKLVVRKSKKTKPLALVTIRAYELRLALDSVGQLRAATDALRSFISRGNINNVLVSSQGSPESPPEETSPSFPDKTPPRYFSAAPAPLAPRVTSPGVQDVSGFFAQMNRQRGVQVGAEGGLRFLAGMETVPPSLDGSRCNPQVNCPEIILVDTKVYAHPDLEGGYRRLYPTEDKVSVTPTFTAKFSKNEDGVQNIKLSPEHIEPSDHGTHMAGIIASRVNDYGIVGLAPDITFYSVNWEAFGSNNGRQQLAELLEERDRNGQRSGRQQILVFATHWPVNGGRLLRQDDRWSDTLADRIRQSTLLVVAAVGQSDDDGEDEPKEIDEHSPDGPMNLGDLDNVITVTACEKCYGVSPRVMATANVPAKNASNMVHVAAPGSDIPSTVRSQDRYGDVWYARASGTSQATAIVAGVVAEMISYWHDFYQYPFNVKRRIQVTSRPTLFSNDQGGKRLSVGIVDPTVALLGPTTNWLTDTDGSLRNIGDFRWLETEIPVTEFRTLQKSVVSTENVLRIYRLEDKGQTYWVFYTKGESNGSINREGPYIINEKFLRKNLIVLGSQGSDREGRGDKYTLGKIQDLLLNDVNEAVVSNTPQ